MEELISDLQLFKENNPEVKIVLTDLREGSHTFSLLEDPPAMSAQQYAKYVQTLRYMDYSKLWDAKSGKIIDLNSYSESDSKS